MATCSTSEVPRRGNCADRLQFMRPSYLGNRSDPENHEFSLELQIIPVLYTAMTVNAKL